MAKATGGARTAAAPEQPAGGRRVGPLVVYDTFAQAGRTTADGGVLPDGGVVVAPEGSYLTRVAQSNKNNPAIQRALGMDGGERVANGSYAGAILSMNRHGVVQFNTNGKHTNLMIGQNASSASLSRVKRLVSSGQLPRTATYRITFQPSFEQGSVTVTRALLSRATSARQVTRPNGQLHIALYDAGGNEIG